MALSATLILQANSVAVPLATYGSTSQSRGFGSSTTHDAIDLRFGSPQGTAHPVGLVFRTG